MPQPDPIPREHPYYSTACAHGLHERCQDTCKFCAAPCECSCGHASNAFVAEQELLQRLSLAIHNTPGFISGAASAWLIAHSVLKELKLSGTQEETS